MIIIIIGINEGNLLESTNATIHMRQVIRTENVMK